MFAQFGAKHAAVDSVGARHWTITIRAFAALTAAAGLLSACGPATVPLAGPDPADPTTKVAAVGYRSTIAPYASLRPSTPAPWRERNDRVAPRPAPDR
jgi:hypothetical protein